MPRAAGHRARSLSRANTLLPRTPQLPGALCRKGGLLSLSKTSLDLHNIMEYVTSKINS